MEAKLIRILVDIELSRTEFEMLADYADLTKQAVNVAAADMMLCGLTLGAESIRNYENPENFAPAAGNDLSMNWPEILATPTDADAADAASPSPP